MRKLFTSLFLLLVAVAVSAQQLPNYGFDSWKNSCGSTDAVGGMRQRPGVEPSDWNGSSINQYVVIEKKQQLIFNEGNAVKMQSKFVGVGSIGANAPGYITLGTPWVYASTTLSDCDGGTYGGTSFSYKPDAITGRFKRTDGNDEDSYIIVYLWNGTFTSNIGKKSGPNQSRDNVDRAILGMTSPTSSGTLVAKCNHAFKSTGGGWQTITVPIEYLNNETPSMMNVVISGGNYWDRNKLKENTTLLADDIKFLYYSELASLEYNEKNYFKKNKKVFEIPGEYDESKLKVTSNGKGAVIEKVYDNDTKVLTIAIKGNDYASNSGNMHEYFVNFGSDEPVLAPESLGSPLESLSKISSTKTYVLYNEHYKAYAIFDPSYSSSNVWTAGMVDGDNKLHAELGDRYSDDVDITDPNSSWVIKKGENNKYSLYNAGAKKYLTTPEFVTGRPEGDLVPCTFSEQEAWLTVKELSGSRFAFSTSGNTNDYMCAAPQSANSPLSVWTIDDNGSKWQLIENPNVLPEGVERPAEPLPPIEDDSDVDYTPRFTDARTREDKFVSSVSVNGDMFTLSTEQRRESYLDATAEHAFVVEPGKIVALEMQGGGVNDGWMNAYVYIDTDKDGFDAGIADDGYTPTGDLVSYSFYNNGADSDESGWNSKGVTLTGNDRSTYTLPDFIAPETPGVYRIRFKYDWCNIDPAGGEGTYHKNNFMGHGGQIVDLKLHVCGFALNQTVATLVEGAALTLKAFMIPADVTLGDIVWSTSNASVANVVDGVVTAVAAGSATITATSGNLSASCEVTVEKSSVPVVGVALDQVTATLFEGETITLTATVTPDDATDKSVVWSTSDENTATVDNGVVTAVAPGVATITAKAGDVSATCEVTVCAEPESPSLELLGYTPADTVASLNKIELTFNGVVELGEKVAGIELRQGIKVAATLEVVAVDSVVTITLAEEIAETGNYILYIPAGAFKFNGAESTFNATLKFVVDGNEEEQPGQEPDEEPEPTPDPEPEPEPDPVVKALELVEYTPADTVNSLSVIELHFNQVVELGDNAGAVALKSGEEVVAEVSIAVVDSVATVALAEEIAVSGDYTLYIPAGAFNTNGAASAFSTSLNFVVKAAVADEPEEPEIKELELVSYTPAGTVNSLKVIELVFNQPVEVGSKIKTVELRQGLKVASSIVEVNIVDSVVTIVLEKELTVSGEYVLCIPEKAFYAKESEHTIAATVKFVVENEVLGVEEILVNQDKLVIYDLTGRKLLEIGRPGVYIINGKKYFIRF